MFSKLSVRKYSFTTKIISVFSFSFLLFLVLQFNINYFLGSDPYYHVTHSSFYTNSYYYLQNWIKLHFFSSSNLEPYFIFHKLGGIFIKLFGQKVGVKILSAALVGVTTSVFYFILYKLEGRKPWVWTGLFLLSSTVFMDRLLMFRPYLLSLPLLLLSYYFIHKEKYILLTLLSTFYILSYSMGILVIFVAAAFVLANIINKRKINWNPLLYSALGVIAGLLIHPETISYLKYIYTQIFQLFYLKISGVALPTGAEINLSNILIRLPKNILTLLALIFSTAVFLGEYKDNKKIISLLPLFLIVSVWTILFLFIPRAIEYWHPFVWFFSALVFSRLDFKKLDQEKIKILLPTKHYQASKVFLVFVVLLLLFVNLFSVYKNIYNFNRNNDIKQSKQVAKYLKDNTPPGSIVFFTNWSLFPKLFYFNQQNRYITGFDPIFAYNYNKKMYWLWLNLSVENKLCSQTENCMDFDIKSFPGKLKIALEGVFETRILLLRNKEDKMLINLLKAYGDYKHTFENKRFSIFKLQK